MGSYGGDYRSSDKIYLKITQPPNLGADFRTDGRSWAVTEVTIGHLKSPHNAKAWPCLFLPTIYDTKIIYGENRKCLSILLSTESNSCASCQYRDLNNMRWPTIVPDFSPDVAWARAQPAWAASPGWRPPSCCPPPSWAPAWSWSQQSSRCAPLNTKPDWREHF